MLTFFKILIAGPFCPRRMAKSTLEVRGATTWLAHILAVLLACTAIAGSTYLAEQARMERFRDHDVNVTTYVAYGGFSQPISQPVWRWEPIIAAALATLFIDIAVMLVFSVAAMPYAWRDESLRDTWRFALRTTRLFTPAWLMPITTWVCFFSYFVDTYPGDTILFMLMAAGSLMPAWSFVIIIRAVTTPRPTPELAIEPICERCGYSLEHVPESRRCPECGEDMTRSIDPTQRWYPPVPGAEREEFAPTSSPPSVAAWIDPIAFFSRVRLNTAVSPLLQVAIAWFVAAGFTGWVLGMLGVMAVDGSVTFDSEMVLAFACACAIVMVGIFGLWSLGTALVGIVASRQTQRNLMRAALVVSSYTSGYFAVWAGVCVGYLSILGQMGNTGMIINPYWWIVCFFLLNGGMALYYVFVVWRRMIRIRYGNWRFTPIENQLAAVAIAPQSNHTDDSRDA